MNFIGNTRKDKLKKYFIDDGKFNQFYTMTKRKLSHVHKKNKFKFFEVNLLE